MIALKLLDSKPKKNEPQDNARATRTAGLRTYFGALSEGKTKQQARNLMGTAMNVKDWTCQGEVKLFLKAKTVRGFKSFTRDPSSYYVSTNHDVLKQTQAFILEEQKRGVVKGVRVSAVQVFVNGLEIVKKHKEGKGISIRTARRVLKSLGYYQKKSTKDVYVDGRA